MTGPNSRLEIFRPVQPIGNTPIAEYLKAVADAGSLALKNWGCTGYWSNRQTLRWHPGGFPRVMPRDASTWPPPCRGAAHYMHPLSRQR